VINFWASFGGIGMWSFLGNSAMAYTSFIFW